MKFRETRIFIAFLILSAVLGGALSLLFYFLSSEIPMVLNIMGILALFFLTFRSILNHRYKKPAPLVLKIVFSLPSWLCWIMLALGFAVFLPNALKNQTWPWILLSGVSALFLAALILKKVFHSRQKSAEMQVENRRNESDLENEEIPQASRGYRLLNRPLIFSLPLMAANLILIFPRLLREVRGNEPGSLLFWALMFAAGIFVSLIPLLLKAFIIKKQGSKNHGTNHQG